MTSYITDHCAWFERCRDNRLLLLHAPPATPLGAGQYLEACHCTSLAPVQKPVFAPGLTSPINSPIARRPSAEGYPDITRGGLLCGAPCRGTLAFYSGPTGS